MKNAKYIVRLALTLLLITAAVAAALAGVNALTKDAIARIQLEKTQKAMEEVLPGYGDFQSCAFRDESGTVKNVYVPHSRDGHGLKGISAAYVVEVAPAGFDGEILMMVGIREGEVTGVAIVSHTETAGLGAVAADKGEKGTAFRQQFAGRSGSLATNKDGGQIQAITGATITSRAVTAGVNNALACQIG